MKILCIFTLLLVLGTPVSIAKQPLVYQEPSMTGNIVTVLKQVEHQLYTGQTDKLASSWDKAEVEWQLLFDEVSVASVNKTYNRLQVSYLQFQQHQDVDTFRRDIRIAVTSLTSSEY